MGEPKRRIGFLHTAAPAIQPLMQFYGQAAADLHITNLLEDGLLALLAQGRYDTVHGRLRSMVTAARETYGSELAMITCSSVPLATARSLQEELNMPVLKIDGPMARRAVETGSRIGIAVTFPPTIEPTSKLLRETASAMGREVELTTHVVEGAYDALLSGDSARHDALLIEGVSALATREIDCIVLAQVSMARVREAIQARCSMPVFSSLDTSLSAIREILDQ